MLKRYIAGILVCVTLVSSVDLSWCDLSGPLSVLAAEVTDCYGAYAKLAKSTSDTTYGFYAKDSTDLFTELGLVYVQDSTNESASIDENKFNWGILTSPTPGLYTLNQQNIEATAQYKSGNWLNDTTYEATAGTPTTEDIFLTTGGTQWIVDLQYRLLKAPYERTYTFSADAANYRYYKLGSPTIGGKTLTTKYVATAEVPYKEDPADYTSFTNTVAGLGSGSNYGYKYFMGFPGKDKMETGEFEVPQIGSDTKATISCYNPEHWTKESVPSKVAPLNKSVNQNYSGSNTEAVPPDVAQAIMVKQNVANAIEDLKAMWEEQADNYRADVGSYNSCGNELKDDELSFMYTYGGMARWGTKQGDKGGQQASHDGMNGAEDPAGLTNYSNTVWNPRFVSYLYDWDGYQETDNMDPNYGSDYMIMQSMQDVGLNIEDFYELVVNICTNPDSPSTECGAEYFAMNMKDNKVLTQLRAADDTDNKASLNYAQRMVEYGAGNNVALLFQNVDQIYAISAPLDDNSGLMGLSTDEVLGSTFTELSGELSDYSLEDRGYLELGYLYYRAIYSIALNYGGMFYADEAEQLFDGLPGYQGLPDGMSETEYDTAVNGNLAACFGNGLTTGASEQQVDIPFACFPRGGDLDGAMNSIMSQSPAGVSDLTLAHIYTIGYVVPDYVYYVHMTFTEDITNHWSDSGTTETYATNKHKNDTCSAGQTKWCAGDSTTIPATSAVPVHSGCVEGDAYPKTDGKCNSCGQESCSCKQTCSGTTTGCTHYKVLSNTANRIQTSTEARDYNHKDRAYEETYRVSVSYAITQGGGGDDEGSANDDWTSDTRYMSDSQTIKQRFEDVQWMDITSYTLWQLHNATARGLSAILASPINCKNASKITNDIVTGAIDQLGYTVYNLQDIYETSGTESAGTDSDTKYTIISKTLTDLQSHGRIANSFNQRSKGENKNCESVLIRKEYTSGNATASTISTSTNAVAYLKNDVPSFESYFINADFASYHLVSEPDSDNLEFKYNPYAQGGRSHTTFYGFVSQALAHTLYFKDSSIEGYYQSCDAAISYGNTLRVQGDYLSLDRTDGSNLTMAGMLYDMWDERFSGKGVSDSEPESAWASGKFSLMPNGWNDLSVYASTCVWVPGRLQYLLSRGNKEAIYDPRGTTVESTNNCFIIHTYCLGINMDKHCCWDSVGVKSSGESGTCKGQYCYSSSAQGGGASTDKGNVNPQLTGGNKTIQYLNVNTLKGIHPYYYYARSNSSTINTSATVKLSKVLADNSGYYEQFSANGTKAYADNSGTIYIPITYYIRNDMNTSTIMTALTRVASAMPYIGYQSQGNGTQLITIDGAVETQKGYDKGYDSNFDKNLTFVSDPNKLNGGFAQFGASVKGNLYTKAQVNYGNKYSEKDEFSAKYPWLSSLNLNRFLPNNRYNTGAVNMNYIRTGYLDDRIACGDCYPNGSGTFCKYVPVRTDHSEDSSLSQVISAKAPIIDTTHYLKGDAKETNSGPAYRPNDIVVYNPVSTESSRIIPLSEFLPDASNTGDVGDSSRYTTSYLDAFSKFVQRDTRLSSKYNLDLARNEEQYLTGDGVNTATQVTKTTYHYALKERSDKLTDYYKYSGDATESDYVEAQTTSELQTLNLNDSSQFIQVNETNSYRIAYIGAQQNAVTIDLKKGDQIYSDNGYILLKNTDNFSLEWKSFVDAYNGLHTEDEEKLTTDSASMNLSENSGMTIGAGFSMRKGSILELKLHFTASEDTTNFYIEDAVELRELPEVFDVATSTEVVTDSNGTKFTEYTWYIEAKQEAKLANLSFDIKENCTLWKIDNYSYLTAKDIVLMYIGNEIVGDNFTSIWYYHDCTHTTSSTGTIFNVYNSYVVDAYGSWQFDGVDITKTGFLYLTTNSGSYSVSLKEDSLSAPHKVPNSNWRYYVLGWETTAGHIINLQDIYKDGSSVDKSPVSCLYNDNTVLVYPCDESKTITVGTLRGMLEDGSDRLLIYKTYSGSYGLMLSSGLNCEVDEIAVARYSEFTGVTIPTGYTFATVNFAYGTAADFHTEIMSKYDIDYNSSYECIWYAKDGDDICYDVAQSHNLAHKCAVGSKDDWDLVQDVSVAFSAEQFKSLFGQTVSLDDEFTIYWDNFANLSNQDISTANLTSHEVTSCSTTLGRGWDNTDESQTDVPYCDNEPVTTAMLPKVPTDDETTEINYWSAYGDNEVLTDTTKWIKSKYVIFNTDMYAFTTWPEEAKENLDAFIYDDANGDQQFDPTTPAYAEDGTPNRIVYIPAGEKVYLGYYKGDSSIDNLGEFIDYGYNLAGKTSNPNKDLYTYHFWCPLSNGETEDNATVQFVVEAINASGFNTNEKSSLINYIGFPKSIGIQNTDVNNNACVDEWGNPIVTASGITLNNNVSVISTVEVESSVLNDITKYHTAMKVTDKYMRYNNSVNSTTYSIQGRVGMLTVVDSGDPRYQDTFKNHGDSTEYAISPIVYAITKYSNIDNEHGSQLQYLTDIMDVRGRFLWKTEVDTDNLYTCAESGDTYADAEWHFAVTEPTRRFALPMTSSFNRHEELRSTLSTSKLGYELYCSLQTIGNYYGSSGPRAAADTVVNNNLDYGQSKIQVHPMYIALEIDGGKITTYPVDVYMRRGTDYALINAGSLFASEEERDKYNQAHSDSQVVDAGPYYLDDAFDATYTSSIATNTGSKLNDCYELDQSMMRRLVTSSESSITYNVLDKASSSSNLEVKNGITTTLLESNTYDSDSEDDVVGSKGLDYSYIYGNAQMLFLREFNRTFMGGTTLALNESAKTSGFAYDLQQNAQRYAQKYYFGLGLPSSAVFVKHGEDTRESNILNGKANIYILCVVDVYSIGEKWALHYQSEISEESIVIDNKEIMAEQWNVYSKTMPHVIPVTLYDMGKTGSTSDLDTRGSH